MASPSRNRRRVNYGQIFMFLQALAIMIALVIAMVFTQRREFIYNIRTFQKSDDYCVTDFCGEYSAALNASLNFEEPPCRDFFKFVCGRYKGTSSRARTFIYNTTDDLGNILNSALLGFVPREHNQTDNDKLALYYQSCKAFVDSGSAVNEINLALKFLGLSGWLDQRKRVGFNSFKYIMDYDIGYELGVIFSFWFQRYRSMSIFTLSPSEDRKSCPAKFSTKDMKDVEETVVERLLRLHGKKPDYTKEAREIVNIESQLCAILEKSRWTIQKVFELGRFTRYLGISTQDWMRGINRNLPPAIRLKQNDSIFASATYIQGVFSVLLKLPRETAKRYVGYRVLRTLKDMEEEKDTLSCLHSAANALPSVLRQMATAQNISVRIIAHIRYIVQNVKAVAKNRIRIVPWLDEITKSHALHTLATIRYQFTEQQVTPRAYLPEFSKNFIENTLITTRAKVMSRLYRRSGFTKGKPMTMESIYDKEKHTLLVHLGLLHRPYYGYSLPLSITFGSLGSVLAKELSRILEGPGNEMWWSIHSYMHHRYSIQCLLDQMAVTQNTGHFTSSNIYQLVDDVVGVKLAYKAYVRAVSTGANPERLRGQYRALFPDHLFFIGYCYTYCHQKAMPGVGDRCNVPLKNLRKFSKAFACGEGSPMSPKHQCGL